MKVNKVSNIRALIKHCSLKGMIYFLYVYLCLVVLYTSSIIGIQFIPRSAIEKNIKSSAEILKEEGLYKIYGWNDYHKLDTFTDALILDMIYSSNPEEPIQSGMLNYMFFDGVNPIDDLNELVNENPNYYECGHYSRYWHGMQVLIRPLLLFTDYTGIRIVNYIFMACLLTVLCVLMWQRITPAITLCFLLTFSVMNSFILPLCMQYCSCFNIAMIGMIALLLWPRTFHSSINTGLLFFILGSTCNFFDLLTTPLVTFGLPFIIYCVIQKQEKPLKFLIILGVIWGVGYGLTFIAKWTIATLLTGENCFKDAVEAVQNRASTTISLKENSIDLNLFYITKLLLYTLWVNFKWIGLCLIIVFTNLFFLNRRKFVKGIYRHCWLLFVAMLVPIWYYFVMRNHSFVHLSLFAWRTLYLSVFSILLFTYLVAQETLYDKNMSNDN